MTFRINLKLNGDRYGPGITGRRDRKGSRMSAGMRRAFFNYGGGIGMNVC